MIIEKRKSDSTSVHHRIDGKKSLTKKHYFDALVSFNKACCFAESKENIANAYVNRSAVYFELKRYKHCLKDIQLAQENGYTGETINERKKKCIQLMETEDDSEFDIWSFLRLSHEPNQKIPFLVDGLELRNTAQCGRGIFTKMDLRVGDIIAIEKPALSFLCAEGQYQYCCKCCKSFFMNLIPCTRSASLMFCSIKCRDHTYKNVDENLDWMISESMQNIRYERVLSDVEEEFCGHEKFLKYIKEQGDITKFNKTIFDYDFVNLKHARLNAIKATLSLMPNKSGAKGISHNIVETARTVAKKDPLIEQFVRHLATVLERNSYLAQYDKDLVGDNPAVEVTRFFPFYSLLNHSCDPNIITLQIDDELLFYVLKPIKAETQLVVNYLGYHADKADTTTRQDKLYTNFGFICDCDFCVNDITPDEDGSIYERALEKAKFSAYIMKKPDDLVENVKENWRLINDSVSKQEISLITMHSHLMLQQVVKLTTKPPTNCTIDE